MQLDLTSTQKVFLGFAGAWFVLMLLGAFRGTDDMWGQTAVFLGAASLWWGTMQFPTRVSFVAKAAVGLLLLVASLAATVLVTVGVKNFVAHIDPMEVWVTLAHYLQVLILIPMDIYQGVRMWIETGNPEAFRHAGCSAPHLFLALFLSVAVGAAGVKRLGQWSIDRSAQRA